SPQSEAIRRPAAVEPVKVILSTRGSTTSDSEAWRSAVIMLSTPGGRPTDSAISLTMYPSAGASGEHFSTTVHPASSAGAILLVIRLIGPFQGMMAPTTPTGSRTINPKPPPAGVASSSKG